LFIFQILVEINGKISESTSVLFAKLYEEYLPKVFRYISYKVTDKNMAEDLTSAVFEKALTKYKTFSGEKASFATWVFSIARNTLIDHFRKRPNRQTVSLEAASSVPDGDPSPDEELTREEETGTLRRCISSLSSQEQEIISLKFGAEMTNREIARATGLSESNVGVILFRTVRKLRAEFNA
jgi:RNA polymerase sigma factor (sigma-70 family)